VANRNLVGLAEYALAFKKTYGGVYIKYVLQIVENVVKNDWANFSKIGGEKKNEGIQKQKGSKI